MSAVIRLAQHECHFCWFQPTAALTPGCAADLRAVAEAMAANAGTGE
jgi:hypothetical protein